ncbi:hypothetical protein C8J56DRAFT_1037389 [Mycena floridula]|nr:hypothetical protein C8J56DRAFT_1037389 [Mycena floridula]
MSTAKRNRLTGSDIIEMAQLQDHWTHGLDTPEYTHSAHLKLHKNDTPAVLQLLTPTLADLLNPVDLAAGDEELLFNHPNPYNFGGMEDDDDPDDDTLSVIIHRGSGRLNIEAYIDLSNKRLLNRYDGKSEVAQVMLDVSVKKWVSAALRL